MFVWKYLPSLDKRESDNIALMLIKKWEQEKKIEKYIKKWEQRGYEQGIPDEAPLELESTGLVPSYRLICISIMKNPNNLELLGYSREICRIYSDIKQVEIYNRKQKNKQLNMFLE